MSSKDIHVPACCASGRRLTSQSFSLLAGSLNRTRESTHDWPDTPKDKADTRRPAYKPRKLTSVTSKTRMSSMTMQKSFVSSKTFTPARPVHAKVVIPIV